MALLPPLRFRRFRSRLLTMIVGLVALIQGVTYMIVSHIHLENAQQTIRQNLDAGGREFQRVMRERAEDTLIRGELMQNDYALRQVLLGGANRATVDSALDSYRGRFQASRMALLDPAFKPLGSSGEAPTEQEWKLFRDLATRAEETEQMRAAGFALSGDTLQSVLVIPVFAPRPQVAAWLVIMQRIDSAFAERLKLSTRLDVAFLATVPEGRCLASSFRDATTRAQLGRDAGLMLAEYAIGEERHLGHHQLLPLLGGGDVHLLLLRSLDQELAPVLWVDRLLLTSTILAITFAMVLSSLLAKSLSDPVQALAEHTRRIARGDYETHVMLRSSDEFSQLAEAFNQMTDGLAERDRMRDLLDKNLSPEIAAQLLKDGSALGGEEREVTILFVDIKGYSRMAEQLPPTLLISTLNHYLEHMSTAIESEGGVIDKYIGDAIMALFGAPLAQADSADRALRAAQAMRRSLATLNEEARLAGQPELDFGIGINTAKVIAGNIGSSRRRNYSVIGDGVNVASRLQNLTRLPEHGSDVILSGSTLEACGTVHPVRPLGRSSVKGRAGEIEIFALERA